MQEAISYECWIELESVSALAILRELTRMPAPFTPSGTLGAADSDSVIA